MLRAFPAKQLTDGRSAVRKPRIHFLPYSELDQFASVRVWAECNKYIVENDLDRAGTCLPPTHPPTHTQYLTL
jgi:hypothetical protein